MHLADAFILCQFVCSLGIEPTSFCAANAILYLWATGTLRDCLSTEVNAHNHCCLLHELTCLLFYLKHLCVCSDNYSDPSCSLLCSEVYTRPDLKRPLHLTFDSYCYMNLSISQLYSSRLSYQTPAMGTVDLCHPTSAAHPHQVQHTTTHQCIHTCRSTTFPIITSCPSSLLM